MSTGIYMSSLRALSALSMYGIVHIFLHVVIVEIVLWSEFSTLSEMLFCFRLIRISDRKFLISNRVIHASVLIRGGFGEVFDFQVDLKFLFVLSLVNLTISFLADSDIDDGFANLS